MYTRIEINWNVGYDRSPDGDMLTGHATIFEGEYINNMKPRYPGAFKFTVTKNAVSMKSEKWSMPAVSDEEMMEVIDMARSYWDGRFHQTTSLKWLRVNK